MRGSDLTRLQKRLVISDAIINGDSCGAPRIWGNYSFNGTDIPNTGDVRQEWCHYLRLMRSYLRVDAIAVPDFTVVELQTDADRSMLM